MSNDLDLSSYKGGDGKNYFVNKWVDEKGVEWEIGQIMTTYHKGFWKLTHIWRRFNSKDEEKRFQGRYGKAGDEKSPLFLYELVLDGGFNPPKKPKKGTAKSKRRQCDASYCAKIDIEWINQKRKITKEQHDRLEALL